MGVSGDLIIVGDTGAGKMFLLELEILAFDLSSLKVEPSYFKEGDIITISCDIANTGTKGGSHTITLKIDDEIKEEKTISLDAGSTYTVTFEVTCESVGEFIVDVNGNTARYEVTKAQTGIPSFPIEATLIGILVVYIFLVLLKKGNYILLFKKNLLQ